jgi:hypothetical protein
MKTPLWPTVTVTCSIVLACQSHQLEGPNPKPETVTVVRFEPNPKLDLLFLIDDSRSMDEEQTSLRNNFPLFIKALEDLPDGVPDLHVAVVSSDFGAGPSEFDTCKRLGKRGLFQVGQNGKDCGLDADKARYLATDGTTQNFQGTLAAAFSCIAELGAKGCGYEHQLQSIKAALSTFNPGNAGFLRDDAYLGIIILSDEDDCSAQDDTPIFDADLPGQSSDLRCATLGHVCGGRSVPATPFQAPLASCAPYQLHSDDVRRDHLLEVADIVDWVKAVKHGSLAHVIVSGVFGWTDAPGATYSIAKGERGLGVEPICQSANGSAAPALRLKSFVDAFGANGSWRSICEGELAGALAGIGQKFADVLSRRCVPEPLVDVEPDLPGMQAECAVVDRFGEGSGYKDVPVFACQGPGQEDGQRCWRTVEDTACPHGHRVDIARGPREAARPTLESIQCLTCTSRADGKQDCSR